MREMASHAATTTSTFASRLESVTLTDASASAFTLLLRSSTVAMSPRTVVRTLGPLVADFAMLQSRRQASSLGSDASWCGDLKVDSRSWLRASCECRGCGRVRLNRLAMS